LCVIWVVPNFIKIFPIDKALSKNKTFKKRKNK
jgi:hypothetical protein